MWLGKTPPSLNREISFPVEAQFDFIRTFGLCSVYLVRRTRITAIDPASNVMALIARLGSTSGWLLWVKIIPWAAKHVPSAIPSITSEYLKRFFVTSNSFLG